VRALRYRKIDASREDIKRWIRDGDVHLGPEVRAVSRLLQPSHVVSRGEQYTVVVPSRPLSAAAPDPNVVFEVVHVDEDVVVVNKPPGLVVHPGAGHPDRTLVNGLLGRGLFLAEDVGDDEANFRPGIVHRIDKETSGLLVVARTARAREALKVQFLHHTIDRAYVAVVSGSMQNTTFDTLHGRAPHDRMRFTTKVREGKRAVTRATVTERFVGATLLSCELETGRTHQIRVHLSEAGFPILGDKLYGKRAKDPYVEGCAREIGHHALHARCLGFVHPRTGKRLVFEAALPSTLAKLVADLRRPG
jgi:23S rRNA pseudouridine1911/1915/1917 synthase